uniref:odorant receptor 13a-like n=1 Tax=Vespula vulgaris TaxID=7454 RepID=UPI00223B9811|nr:odorant receptor 13a-like [Vespula vulgaris]
MYFDRYDVHKVSYVDYVCGWNQKIMKFMGIWPDERGFAYASSYKVLFPIGLMFLFISLPQTTNLYFIWGDFDLIVENLSVGNMTTTIAILKTATFWSNGRYMKLLLSRMENDRKEATTEENVKKMMRIADISRKITAGSIIMCNILVITYVILRTLLLPYTGRSLYYRGYFPYDSRTFPNFELTLIAQITAAVYTANNYTAVDTFMTMLMLHVCGQISCLRKTLTRLCSENNNNFRIDLRRIVEKYDMLNKYAEIIEDRFNGILLIQMLGCTVQLCVQWYQAISALVDNDQGLLIVRLFFFAVYTTYVMLHIYLYCYVGQKLFSEGTKMAYAAYDCSWYNLSPNEAKYLTIIMCRAQISSRITAGKFCTFNHELFGKILKTSMGYLSVLYAMKTKDIH